LTQQEKSTHLITSDLECDVLFELVTSFVDSTIQSASQVIFKN
jgi:esterase/lipase